MDPTAQFKKYLYYSIAFHVVVILLFLVLAEHAPVRKFPETKITMVRLAPRLGLPTGSPEAPPGIPQPTPIKPETAPPPEVTAPKPQAAIPPKVETPRPEPKPPRAKPPPPKPASKIVVRDSRIKTPKVKPPDPTEIQHALSEIDQDLAQRQREIEQAQQTAGSPGTPSAGPAGLGTPEGEITARDPGYAQYQASVRSRIIRNWVRTHAGSETEKLFARIRVHINASGQVISKTFSKRSGDAAFDNSALRAVEQASPFPPPPAGIRGEALQEGFIIDFRARIVGQR